MYHEQEQKDKILCSGQNGMHVIDLFQLLVYVRENDVGIKGLCTGFRHLVRAVRRGASVDLRIFISSDWRSLGVTPGLDVCIAT